ncbi:TIGR02679 family protein [Ralstonia solanacearum]|nr:TIGR02679 family protein [Ralstonia solanacearum]MBB6589424.1 TIGR02679 family protein [Ralstonia solanacearum]MCG3574883.1 TIGR02679 family protein [Ralstonia solanacearum]MCL9824399.1 TIGR02679 family protein [Ralstonia solanacearum]MCL9829617.1 TIGR02679 family protein [Ralstonia solanacearum]MCL9834398.1 TIGR02679 family protein [Ralstonia solanacearum]
MSSSEAKLQRLLGGPALLSLRQRLRRHFERQSEGETRVTLQLTKLSAGEHEALALLTGRTSRTTRSMRIDITQIDAALQAAGICCSLRVALERLDGPIQNRAAERAAIQAAWSEATQYRGGDARLQAWLDTPAAGPQLKRLARQDATAAQTLVRQADAVLRGLPAPGLARAQLAAQTLGNAHALDAGQPVASIVLAAWRYAEATMAPSRQEALTDPEGEFDGDEADDRGEGTSLAHERARDIWARAGILVNELARPALMLNLPILEQVTASWIAGEPAYLSLRQLVRTPPAWAVKDAPVFVCENPNLLAIAADRLGARCAPLVCTDGMPAAAQRALLTQLLHAGARLYYHGDFDWPGLRIANHVIRTWRAIPWRLAASDYEAAVKAAPHVRRDLDETDAVAVWDPLLTPAMHGHGLSIAEEAVADGLIEDLRPT